MRAVVFIVIAFYFAVYVDVFDFKKKTYLDSFIKEKHGSKKEIIDTYCFQVFWVKTKYIHCNMCNFNLKMVECKKADKVKEMITEYINDESKRVYENVFITTLEENNNNYIECYFPRSHEVSYFWSFVEDNVVNDAKDKIKAMKLLIDLCYLYRNNAEFSVELFAFAIIKATINNPTLFVKELAGRSQSQINLCINKLKYLKNYDDIVKIKTEIENIKEPEYQEVVNNIKAILDD
ncbi:MAG: hypothetical protein ACLFRI_07930 [Candidatus Izemoplasmataceae bacterium]